jgi:S-DNA-T family DNA segregation ATPase FtsK/SpoIIIE
MGLSLVALSFYIAACLFTFDSFDPSFNTAINGPVHNIGGTLGARLADLLMQSFSYTSYLLCLVFLSWGWAVLRAKNFKEIGFRILGLPFALILASLALTTLFSSNVSHLGGIVGQILNHKIEAFFQAQKIGVPPVILGVLEAIIAITLLFYVLSLKMSEWRSLFLFVYRSINFVAKGFYRIFKVISKRKLTDDSLLRSVMNERRKGENNSLLKPLKPLREKEPSLTLETKEQHSDVKLSFHIEPKAPSKDFSVSPSRSFDQKAPEKLDFLEVKDEQLPSLTLLRKPATSEMSNAQISEQEIKDKASHLKKVLEEFGVRGDIVKVHPGPVVTLYELVPAAGIKSSRIIGLADDIARSMSALSARIAVIPGRNAIGVELPNDKRQTVSLYELLSHKYYEHSTSALTIALGKDIAGDPVVTDLARMPHVLVAGTTGSGKSVGINAMILSLLYRLPPQKCRMIMIDPKMLELSIYDGIPHLLTPVVTEPRKAIFALKWAVREMEDRYRAMSRLGVRNIEGYNARLHEAQLKGETLTRKVQTGFDPETGKPVFETEYLDMTLLPYIVIIVDEMADLMMVAGKDIEAAVQRLAQMARAAGLHLIMATQRPSVDVITGTIKANFPTRISFQVASRFDSRTILGEQGSEQLLGKGDMLFMEAGGKLTRVHGPFVSDQEVENVVRFLKSQGDPDYIPSITEEQNDLALDLLGGSSQEVDELYRQALELVRREGKASTSFIQRHLKIGYNRAARIIEQMESEGIVSAANHVGKREVIMKAG